MSENINYTKEVSAKIIENPDFEIEENNITEISVSSIGAIHSSIINAGVALIEEAPSVSTKVLKFTLTGMAKIPFTAINIAISATEEGPMLTQILPKVA